MGAQAFIPPSMAGSRPLGPEAPRSRGAEAWALISFAVATFLVLALATARFHPEDPTVRGADWMGAVGSFVSRVLIQGFGAAAWWVPIELFLIGAPLLRGRRPELVGLRLAGDLLVLVLVASLLQVAVPEVEVFGHALAGGNVGLFFGELMRGLFSAPGSFLVGFTGIGLIFIGRSSFSFIEWCGRAVALYHATVAALVRGARELRDIWVRASEVRAEQARLKKERGPLGEPDRDEVILSRLEADTPWIPLEATGVPPLELSESLRARLWNPVLEEESDVGAKGVGPVVEPPNEEEEEADAEEAGEEEVDGFWAAIVDDEDDACRDDGAGSEAESIAEDEDEDVEGEDLEDGDVEGDEFEGDEESLDEESDFAEEDSDEHTDIEDEEDTDDGLAAQLVAEPRIVDTSSAQATRAGQPERTLRQADGYRLPATDLLEPPEVAEHPVDKQIILKTSELLEKTLADYGVTGHVQEIHPGPTVTTYEVAPSAGTKVSKVAGLSDDLALGLSRKVRIIAPIPGKSRIGFEIPNDERIPVNLRELVEDERFHKLSKKAPLPVVLGRDIVGAPFYADLASMPHVIVAGATGAGKSVGLNVMLSSLLFKRTPEELRLLMIDPKVVELAPFDRIPHLLLPVVTDMNQASQALKWAVDEMERRYQLFADAGTKNIGTYNRYVERVRSGEIPPPRVTSVEVIDHNGDLTSVPVSKKGTDGHPLPDKLPYIVIVVDEFADLIMQQGKEVETSVARLAQKARAAGMHVILATQRPSVDVITGMIKANFPSRIAFRVAQKVDSRTILDEMGAEVLLGRGDMLVKLNGATDTKRVQCPFVSEEEVSALTDHIRAQAEPRYEEDILRPEEDEPQEEEDEKVDARFDEAVLIVRDTQRCSTSWLQRKMTIGYNRAAKIVDMMERRGYVGPPNGSKDREVIITP
jgi:S-DNA-T family DNA segregation ATPase FtsK/SpoIIIE